MVKMAMPTWAKQTTLISILGSVCTLVWIAFLYWVDSQHLVVPIGLNTPLPMVYIPIVATAISTTATSFFWLVGMKSVHIALLRKLNKAENLSLSAEVQGDKVKQLESQISTLETALCKALKS
jgi:hypothetical protein